MKKMMMLVILCLMSLQPNVFAGKNGGAGVGGGGMGILDELRPHYPNATDCELVEIAEEYYDQKSLDRDNGYQTASEMCL